MQIPSSIVEYSIEITLHISLFDSNKFTHLLIYVRIFRFDYGIRTSRTYYIPFAFQLALDVNCFHLTVKSAVMPVLISWKYI